MSGAARALSRAASTARARASWRARSSPSPRPDGRDQRWIFPSSRKLKKELADLKHELTFELPKELAAAAAHGDLSENAEYEAAKHRQDFVRSRIAQLEGRIRELSMYTVASIPQRRGRVRQPGEAGRRRRRHRRAGRLPDRVPRGGRRRARADLAVVTDRARAHEQERSATRSRCRRPAAGAPIRSSSWSRSTSSASRTQRADRAHAGSASRRRRARLLGGDGVREDARRPLHAELVAEVRHDLPVPVELGAIAAVERARVQRDAVGGIVAGLAEPRQRVDEQLGQRRRGPRRSTAPKSASCVTGLIQVSYGYAEANGVKLDEVAALRDHALARRAASRPAGRRTRSAPCGGSTRARPPSSSSMRFGVNGVAMTCECACW